MRLLIRWLRRFAVLGLGIVGVWFIVFVLRITDRRLPTILALSLTYAIAAYVILPRVVRMGLKILQRKSVPSFTLTGDGLPADPVNLALIGEFERLRAAFARAGWIEADPLNLRSSWGMAVAFVLNRPYPAAPFSWLYLFGRKQDVGFQKAIDMSPRKRHHIRFWALSLERAEDTLNKAEFWLNIDRPPLDAPVLWIGAGTRDTGISLTKLTFQVTHATNSDTKAERDFHPWRAETVRRHRRSKVAPGRRTPEPRARQSLCRRPRSRRCDAGVIVVGGRITVAERLPPQSPLRPVRQCRSSPQHRDRWSFAGRTRTRAR